MTDYPDLLCEEAFTWTGSLIEKFIVAFPRGEKNFLPVPSSSGSQEANHLFAAIGLL